MNYAWQKVAFLACIGFTMIMAGANLAHMTATANGSPVPIFGLDVPHRFIMAVGAVCLDAVIIISPFALQRWHQERRHSAFFVVLALWLGCSAASVKSVHDWQVESSVNSSAPAEQAERRAKQLTANLKDAKERLSVIQGKLINETDRDRRRILQAEEVKAKALKESYEGQDWQATTVHVSQPDDLECWIRALVLWGLSVGCWVGFMGGDEKPVGWDGKRDGMGRMGWDGKPSQPFQPWEGLDGKPFQDGNILGNQTFPASQNGTGTSHPIPPQIPPPSHPTPSPSRKGGKDPVERLGSQGPSQRPENVVDLRPGTPGKGKMSEVEAIRVALELRATVPPTSWPKIAEITGWAQSSIHRKCSAKSAG